MAEVIETREFKELMSMVREFDAEAINSIKPEDFVSFGMRDSRTYRALFLKLTKDMEKSDRTWVVILAVAIKNRERILMELGRKFQDAQWRNAVIAFYTHHTATRNSDIPIGRELMPVVNIPSCAPPITALIWKKMQEDENLSYDNFVGNLWTVQLKVYQAITEEQKVWEMDYWERQITKGGRTYEKGFNEEYWTTKSKDRYMLLTDTMEPYKRDKRGPYNRADIEEWLAGEEQARVAKARAALAAAEEA